MKSKRFILSIVLLALIAAVTFAGCNDDNGGADTPTVATEDVQTIGQGATVFRFEMIDENEAVSAWDVHTDETTVGAALLDVGLIAGEESEWGLMVMEVDGVVADWDANQSFWAFYVDGGFAMAGVDETDIESGVTYAFVYTQG